MVKFNNNFLLILLSLILFTFEANCKSIRPEQYHTGGDDYTMAIQKCIDIASQSGGAVEFTADRYRVTGGMLKLKSNVTLYSRVGSCIYTSDKNNYKSILYQDMDSVIENITIKGLCFDQSMELNSPYYDRINYYILLLYRAKNITVEDCTFHHVGTNCIVVNGPECFGSKIVSNEIKFTRIPSAGHYDVSSIYITDGEHYIADNYIYNDGQEINRQGGGLETHGPVGVVKGNTIVNCYNAINVVSSDNLNPHGFKRTITRNKSVGCYNFLMLWSITGQEINNVKIKNNSAIGLRTAVGVQPGNDLTGTISNVLVSKNKFVGQYHKFENETNAANSGHLLRYEAIAIHNYGDTRIKITKNYFYDFPAILVDLNAYNKTVHTELFFIKNKVYNSYNSEIVEPLRLQSKFSLFCVGLDAKLIVMDNDITVSKLHPSIPPALMYGYQEGTVLFSDNTFKGMNLPIVRSDINSFDSRIFHPNYKPRDFDKFLPTTINKGDRIINNGEIITCLQQGTNKTIDLGNGYLHGGGEMFVTCQNYESIEVGDWIVIQGEEVGQQARQVIAIVEDRVYLKGVNAPLKLGETKRLSKIAYFPYMLDASLN